MRRLRARMMAQAWPLRLLAVAGLLGLGSLLRVLLFGAQPGEGYPVFIPIVVLCGLLFGLAAGLLATAGAWVVGTFFFTEPPFSFVLDDPFDITAALLFPLLAVLLLVFIELWVSILGEAERMPPPGGQRPR